MARDGAGNLDKVVRGRGLGGTSRNMNLNPEGGEIVFSLEVAITFLYGQNQQHIYMCVCVCLYVFNKGPESCYLRLSDHIQDMVHSLLPLLFFLFYHFLIM